MGIEFQIFSGHITKALNASKAAGLLVLSLSSKGAASKMGLKGGPIVAITDGKKVILGGDIISTFAIIGLKDSISEV